MRETAGRLLDAVYLASIWIAGAAILVMSFIIPWGVFTRYVLGSGSQWPEPIAILLMMVFTFIGAAAGMAAADLPGLSLVPAIAMGIGAMCAAMLGLPLTSTLLATVLVGRAARRALAAASVVEGGDRRDG